MQLLFERLKPFIKLSDIVSLSGRDPLVRQMVVGLATYQVTNWAIRGLFRRST